ncbi:MAG: acetate--CoA ligase family protein [Candidatus Berkelbacteria bacterium]
MDKLEKIIAPRSIAVVGASDNIEKVGGIIFHNLLTGGFKGDLYPVNPTAGTIQGQKAYKTLSEIDKDIDLVCIAIPADFVLQVVNQVVALGIKSIVIVSAGFSELGSAGKAKEEALLKLCADNDISLLGPNCLGLINSQNGMNCSFSIGMPLNGNISVISQSGAIISALIDWSVSSGVGFDKIFSIGNKADIDECELLEYLYANDTTKVIVMYLENLDISQRLSKILIKHSKEKPTVILFGGKSSYGSMAAASHTGSMVSSYDAIKTYLVQSGVIVANSISRLFNLCALLSAYRHIDGKSIAIVTNAGGPAIIACDSLAYYKLKLAKIEKDSTDRLTKLLRPQASKHNPIDILGDGDEVEYNHAIEVLQADDKVDAIVALLTIQSNTPTEKIVREIKAYQGKKPLVCAFIGGEVTHGFARELSKSGHPCFAFPEDAIAAFAALNFFSHSKVELLPANACTTNFDKNDLHIAAERYKLPVARYFHVSSEKHVLEIADKLGYPVVLKTGNEEIIHKTESNAVILDIKTPAELQAAYDKIGKLAIIGKMIKTEHEIFIGAKRYGQMGTVVIFGTGGIYAEIYKDTITRFAPITKAVALEMIAETKIGQILAGARGKKPYDLDKLAEIIVNTARFVEENCNIKEVDFNPLIASKGQYHIVDARIITEG